MANLNLTQRQICEKLAESMRNNNKKASGLQAFLIFLRDYESGDINVQDLIDFGIINSNKAINSVSWTTDPVINGSVLESRAILFHHRGDVYVNQYPYAGIMNAIQKSTLLEYFSKPIMNTVRQAGSLNLVQYAKSIHDYGTTSFETTLYVQIGNQQIDICHLVVNGDTVQISNINDDSDIILEHLSITVAGTEMIERLCQALADGISSPSDLAAIIGKYTTSQCASISSFASQILRQGRDTTQSAIFNIISLFRSSSTEYTEDEDGRITWELSTHPVATNFWMVAGNIIVGGLQMIGSILMFAGTVIVKVVGGLLYIGASIIQALATFVGSIAGTNPLINEEAIDQTYHDPIAQCNKQDITDFKLDPDLWKQLEDYGRAKIVVPSATLYLYNYYVDDWGVKYIDWKLFSNMSTPCPSMRIGISSMQGWTGMPIPIFQWGNAMWSTGFLNCYLENGSALAKYSFTIDNNFWSKYIENDGNVEKLTQVKSLNQWVEESAASCNSASGISIKTNSPDAADWTNFWDVLRENTLQTLTYVFSNPLFYNDGDTTISSDDTSVYDLRSLIGYGHTTTENYAKVINTVIDLGNISHKSDNFLLALLNSIGLETSDDDGNIIYEKTLSVEVVDNSIVFDPELISVNKTRAAPVLLDDYVGLFPFLSIDSYAYATPPSSDFKSVIWGAILATTLVATVIATVMIGRTVIKKKVEQKMYRSGQNLMNEGSNIKDRMNSWEELSATDRKQLSRDYKRYQLKVKVYNFAAKCLGLSSIDWVNSWWNPYESNGSALISPVSVTPDGAAVIASADLVDSADSLSKYADESDYYEDHPTDAIILYRLISGRNPS